MPAPTNQASAGSFDPTKRYRLTNNFLGPSTSLDVVNDNGTSSSGKLNMAANGLYSGQYWTLNPLPGGKYSLSTMFLGPDMRLTITEHDPTPRLAKASTTPGWDQVWMITQWGDGKWKISNEGAGQWLSMDTYFDTKDLFMGNGDHSGMHWSINPIPE